MKSTIAGLFAGCLTLVFLNTSYAQDNDFHGQDLSGKSYLKQKLDGANFEDANLKGVNFSGSSLRKANFKGADLSGAWLNDADLSGADLRGAKDYIASRSHFDGANLQGNSLRTDNCTYRGANLRDTKVSGYIYNCDFSGADFSGANLRLMAVNADSNKWKGVIYDDDTSWPDGFDPVKVGAILKSSAAAPAADNASNTQPPPASTQASATAPGTNATAPVNPFTATQPDAAPSAAVAGKYVGENNKEAWCQLNADGTLVFHEGGRDMNGTFTVDGNTVTMTVMGETIKTTIDGNTLNPPGGHGQKLIKQ